MDVYSAVNSRQSIRAFTAGAVPREALDRVLAAAAYSPSGSNLQPWHIYVVQGARLARLKKQVAERIAAGDSGDEREYPMYPPSIESPYRERLADLGELRYGALGIARDDMRARLRERARNWDCYGASTALFCYLDRDMPVAQWADAGMYLQTVMLLLRAEELHSCAQVAWSEYHRTVAEAISPSAERILFCGMSIGYADPSTPHPRIPRAPLEETVTFLR